MTFRRMPRTWPTHKFKARLRRRRRMDIIAAALLEDRK